MKPTLRFYKVHPSVPTPEFATSGSACFDLSAFLSHETYVKLYNRGIEFKQQIEDGKLNFFSQYQVLIPTGLILDIPEGYHVEINIRSGVSLKKGIFLVNGTGIIDSDYVDPVGLIIACSHFAEINHGDRIAQARLVKTEKIYFNEMLEPPQKKTNRDGGFGSTGLSSTDLGKGF